MALINDMNHGLRGVAPLIGGPDNRIKHLALRRIDAIFTKKRTRVRSETVDPFNIDRRNPQIRAKHNCRPSHLRHKPFQRIAMFAISLNLLIFTHSRFPLISIGLDVP
ncbi:hypothetical protein BWR17_18955 (plasmid) [Phaeobacter inhibens]|uniref:hypothetical protein n=1 Tax=Phaeobacter inhibens TaxID=221822 RepID=UPI000971B739|nr:hypothetical protein [Phaeobacter inhibens]APX17975.1 hypothetical protein BWR17_18955 [Phaeobacter inhibens]